MELNNETIKQAKQELEAICKKYEIALIPVVTHQGNRTTSSIEIVPVSVLTSEQTVASDQA